MPLETFIPLIISVLTAVGVLYKTLHDTKDADEKRKADQRQAYETAWQAGMAAANNAWASLCEKQQSRLDQMAARIERYEERIDHLERELQEANDKIDQLERERNEANARIKILEQELRATIQERDKLRLEMGKRKGGE
jgi:predicted RNase H-like nuclease (RuvC/YqgF family)